MNQALNVWIRNIKVLIFILLIFNLPFIITFYKWVTVYIVFLVLFNITYLNILNYHVSEIKIPKNYGNNVYGFGKKYTIYIEK